MVLLFGINGMSNELEKVYQENLTLNTLSENLNAVQDSMTEYLNIKTTEALENYYRSEQDYNSMIQEMTEDVSSITFKRMQRNIKNMSEEYLDLTSQTIEAKRGRNVEKYGERYGSATRIYEYIDSYIYGLNIEQFITNSQNYNELSSAFRVFESVSIIVMAVVIIINVAIIIKFTGNMIQPLKNLSNLANEVAKGNLDIELRETNATDEIGVVTSAFNQMVVSLRQYIERIKESMEIERQLKEKELLMEAHLTDAQLKYLQAQINPHFLYNILDMIYWFAEEGMSEEISIAVKALSPFYRISLSKGKEIITLKEEAAHVGAYIKLQNLRFQNSIHYEAHIDPSLMNCLIVKTTFQPIIENAILHGIQEKDDSSGTITLDIHPLGTHDIDFNVVEANGIAFNCSETITTTCDEWNTIFVNNENDEIILELAQDNFGDETTWEIINDNKVIVASGGPYEYIFGETTTELHQISLQLPLNQCLKFIIKDASGNGMCCEYGEGYYRIKDSCENIVIEGDGAFGSEASHLFSIEIGDNINETKQEICHIHPNPANDFVTIKTHNNIGDLITISDISGRTLITEEVTADDIQINIADLTKGLYIIKVGDKSEKLIIRD